MRWKGRRGSSNVEDRRGRRAPVVAGGGGLLLIGIVVVALCMGADPSTIFQKVENAPVEIQGPPGETPPPENDEVAQFVSVVLADTEEVWAELFRTLGARYREPQLVLFSGRVESACGFQSAAVGPFYCPSDQTVYIDLSFFEEMSRKLGAPGDFAQAYVIAHEVGHHVQNLLGVSDEISAQRQRAGEVEANRLSVRQELQADYFAGVWAHHAQRKFNILQEGDIEEALGAANAIGDDRLQMRSRGYEVPESFTHGTSKQRIRWFARGFKTGDVEGGNTYSINYDSL